MSCAARLRSCRNHIAAMTCAGGGAAATARPPRTPASSRSRRRSTLQSGGSPPRCDHIIFLVPFAFFGGQGDYWWTSGEQLPTDLRGISVNQLEQSLANQLATSVAGKERALSPTVWSSQETARAATASTAASRRTALTMPPITLFSLASMNPCGHSARTLRVRGGHGVASPHARAVSRSSA